MSTRVHRVSADHPAFAGHFPGQPLLPGALLLATVLEAVLDEPALARRLGPSPTLAAAKFLAPVGPGSELTIGLREEAGGLHFEVSSGARTVARGQFAWGDAA
jgi:3-hydroxymyristoyl/3-hydroxydecanoyl-(acyl carrier protein) dehydratase